jgi:hypothetical protein
MSIEERFPEEELDSMIENITEENKEERRGHHNFLSINELLKIVEKKVDTIPTDKMKLLMK